MIDYLKLWITDKQQIERIKGLPFLEFTQEFSTRTGEGIDYTEKAQWECMEISLHSFGMQIAGSIHKYYKGGNEGDFTFDELQTAIRGFSGALNLDPNLAWVKNVEIGVNITPDMEAEQIISQMLCFKNKEPNYPYRDGNDNFIYTEFPAKNYFVKIYDKGKQYNTENTLRLEVKLMRSIEFNCLGLHTLQDLTDRNVYINLAKKFIGLVPSLKFTDNSIDEDELSVKQRDLYLKFNNPKSWATDRNRSRQQRRDKGKFIAMVNRYGQHKLNLQIPQWCDMKVNELCNN